MTRTKTSHVKQRETDGGDETGVCADCTSFTLSSTAASSLARVTTDVFFELTTAADSGSGRTSVQHNNNQITHKLHSPSPLTTHTHSSSCSICLSGYY